MSDLAEKLMELLSDNENLEKIQNLGQLIATAGNHEEEKSQQEEKSSSHAHQQAQENSDVASIDMIQTVMKLMPLLSSLNKEDNNTRLLYALRPHLSEKRQAKLDESIKIVQLFKVLPLLRSQGIF